MFSEINFLPITEKAAMAVTPSVGQKDKYRADDLATSSMRENLNLMAIDAQVVIGEGEMDEAPMLYIGEKLGKGGVSIDIAVDPLEGTNLAAKNQYNAITVMALTPRGGLLGAPDMYMKKIAVGEDLKGLVDVRKSLGDNLESIFSAKPHLKTHMNIALLDRDRHEKSMKEAIEMGCKLTLLSDGDILPAILTGIEGTGVHMLYGIGAAPEGVISAAALKVLGGDFQGMLVPETKEQEERCLAMGISDPKNHFFSLNDLVKSNEIQVVLSAVTSGYLGDGVKYSGKRCFVNSLKLSTSGAVLQRITSEYKVD